MSGGREEPSVFDVEAATSKRRGMTPDEIEKATQRSLALSILTRIAGPSATREKAVKAVVAQAAEEGKTVAQVLDEVQAEI